MTIRNKQHTLLLAIVFATAAVCSLLLPHSTNSPVQPAIPVVQQNGSGSGIFPTMHSSRAAPTEAETQQELANHLHEALVSEDRAAAFAHLIDNANAPSAIEWARSINDDHLTRSSAMQAVFAAWGQRDPKAAGAYVSTLAQTDQPDAIVAVTPELVRANVTEAITWAGAFDDADARDIATHQVVIAWANDNPAEAAKWAASQPESFNRADQVRSIVEKWMDRDATAAMNWVGTLPQGISRDTAIDFIANQYTKSNPTFAANCALLIGTTELRDSRLDQLTSAWLQSDPNAARNWIDSSSLPEATKTRLATASSP